MCLAPGSKVRHGHAIYVEGKLIDLIVRQKGYPAPPDELVVLAKVQCSPAWGAGYDEIFEAAHLVSIDPDNMYVEIIPL
jgi:hypothetical protein